MKRLYQLCPLRTWIVLLSGLVIGLHLLTRSDHVLNQRLSESFVRPVHRWLSAATGRLPFSAAELLLGLAALGLAAFLLVSVARLLFRKGRLRTLYRTLMGLAAFGLGVYALFCLLWGVYYYGDDFTAKSGLKPEPVSAQELALVTAFFADRCNEYGAQVPRNARGAYVGDREEILRKSPELYRAIEAQYPCLKGPAVPAKGFHFSRLLSYTDFSGFFFPFTAEANVNTDFPPSLFASTVAHELAHQRGVAKEQEANFVAVLASYAYGDPDYCYSASLLAYIHLSNALYGADRAAWERISRCLSPQVRRDMQENRLYWRQFETPVQTVSNTVYESFLYSYDQDLGLKSYGACVDLLVKEYRAAALGQ